MTDIKRGTVVLLQAGDPEISGAIAEGIIQARATSQSAGELTGERRRQVAKLVKVAVGNTLTAEDYMILRACAEQEYAVHMRGPLARLLDRALDIYGLFVYAVSEAFRAQDKILGRHT